jgi:nucleotide-binding universal stress UspA family protein
MPTGDRAGTITQSDTCARITLLRRFGVPANHLVKVAQETAADLIVLAWNQNLDHGHARVVADTLTHCKIPVLLLPARLTPASAATSVASQ